ncbi:hypothetical protein [Streptomyces sp. JB150]|uniref:hypothetical protein n=1 Tax=Streptomyces sp. JB150 TaxID=2714844 RepID=UPI00140AE402|nr:hypothetical protein [Streptomyces sp. JB150]QIJ65218.1 hypothetical protein G7Z13_26690 [Streptomyces sp. JB150]
MDPVIMSAGTALIAAMATDAWQQARAAVLDLWRRRHPERVPAVEGELAEVREEVLRARRTQDGRTEEGLAEEWDRRLRRLVAGDPELTRELERVRDERLYPLLPDARRPSGGSRTNIGYAVGRNSQVFQASGDINYSSGGPAGPGDPVGPVGPVGPLGP